MNDIINEMIGQRDQGLEDTARMYWLIGDKWSGVSEPTLVCLLRRAYYVKQYANPREAIDAARGRGD